MAKRRHRLTPAEMADAERAKAIRKRDVEALIARGLSVNHDHAWNIIAVRRLDVFSLLHERKSLSDAQFYAIRRYEEAVAVAGGHERPEQSFDRVDRSSEGAPGQNVTKAMIDASERVRFILRRVGPTNARLLEALTDGKRENATLITRWRPTVEAETKETRPEVQSAMVRTACENVDLVWRKWDAGERDEKHREQAA